MRALCGSRSERSAASTPIPRLRRIQLANASSIVGGWAYVVALAVFAYRADGAYAVGLLATVRWLCGGVAAPLAGVVGDRYPRVRVMIASDLVRAGLLGGMALAVARGRAAAAVYALAVAATLAATPFGPAQAALLPQLARSPAELTAANASAGAVDNVGSFVGPALGGLLVAGASVEVSLRDLGRLVPRLGRAHRKRSGTASKLEHESDEERRAAASGRRSPASHVSGSPRLRLIVGLVAAQTVVDGALDVLIVVLALETLEIRSVGPRLPQLLRGRRWDRGGVVVGGLAARGRLATSLGVGIALWGAADRA